MARKPVAIPPLTMATLRVEPTAITVTEESMRESGQPKFCTKTSSGVKLRMRSLVTKQYVGCYLF